jgi:diguanylate cyclase (GGDEF)-like protein/PAS domain S-box-containing protein
MNHATISAQTLVNALMASTPDHVYFKDQGSRFILVSASLAHSFGCKIEEVVGRTDFDFFADPQARAFREAEVTIMATGDGVFDRVVKHVWPDGHITWSLNVALPLRDENNQIVGIWGTNKDITAAKLLEQEAAAQKHRADEMTKLAVEKANRVEYLAYHDGLTGLPNRSLFSALLNQSISEAHRYNRQLAVAFLDLDRFKQINDTLGHEAGDQLLQEVATRLKASVRDSDTVGRLGGDEFVVLLPELPDGRYAEAVAQKILAVIAKPFTLIGNEFRVTASVGISTYPQDGLDEQTLTKNADIAMYQAKEEGRNNFQFYSEKLNVNSLQRLALESSLRRALERQEFQLHYQAKRDIGNGSITGMEALLRWEHPDLGTIAPLRFIPVAEETGLIVPIGKWVLRTACLQNVAWQKQGLPPVCIAVNLTAGQFSDENLVQDVTSILAATGMDPHLLELEITESLLIHDVESTLRVLTALKALGIRIAIDDFGTGYSTLATLQRFPLDTIKIDRSFIRDITSATDDTGLADAVIAIGKSLSLNVVAQGVETKDQAAFLRAHACDELQGFYFNRPLPADQFTKLLLAQATENTYTGGGLGLQIVKP